jgi:protein TonB
MVARLKRTVLRAATSGSGGEIGGVLLGTATEEASGALVLDVSDFAALPSADAPDRDYIPPLEQIRSLREAQKAHAIGYFRTQGDTDLRMRPHEAPLAREFSNGAAVALLLSPAAEGRVLAGLIYSDGMEFRNAPAKRFEFNEAALGPLRPAAPLSSTPIGVAPARSGRYIILSAVAGLSALLAGAAAAYWWSGARLLHRSDLAHADGSTAPAATAGGGLDLGVNRVAGGLMVSWNGAGVNATGGQLIVTDGDLPSEIIPLAADDVRKSKIFYRTNSERLRFRVELVDPGGRRWSDSVLVLGGTPLAGSSGSESRLRDKNVVRAYREQPPVSSAPPPEPHSYAPASSASPPSESPAWQPQQTVSARAFQPPPQQASKPVERTIILDSPPSPLPVGAPAVQIAQTHLEIPAPPAQNPPAQKLAEQPVSPSFNAPAAQRAAGPSLAPASAPRQYTGPVVISQITPRLEPAIRSVLVNDVEVEVTLHIDASGRVVRADPVQRLTGLYQHIERAAVNAAERWRFQPATIDGKTVPSVQTIKFLFRK